MKEIEEMTDTPSREDAPTHLYVVMDLDGPVETFYDEDEAYEFADYNELVVTYSKI